MRLVCPSCAAAYDIPDTRLGAGSRRVRCARCAHLWTLERPPSAVPTSTAPPPPDPSPPPSLTAEPRHPPAAEAVGEKKPPSWDRWAIAAWAASLLAVIGIGVTAVQLRAELMHHWPPSQRLYALFGAAAR